MGCLALPIGALWPSAAVFFGLRLDSAAVESLESLIAPSILSADFARLADEVAIVHTGHQSAGADSTVASRGADWLHVDVMDNHFVPNLTLGPPVVRAVRAVTDLPLDCHLMIEQPERWAPEYAELGAYNVTIHAEATADPTAVGRDIRAAGALAGLAIKPGTRLDAYEEILPAFDTLLIMTVEPGFGGQQFITDVLPKIRRARQLIHSGHLQLHIEVDGGINADTIALAAQAGADVFVAGSAVYGASDPIKAITALRDQADQARGAR